MGGGRLLRRLRLLHVSSEPDHPRLPGRRRDHAERPLGDRLRVLRPVPDPDRRRLRAGDPRPGRRALSRNVLDTERNHGDGADDGPHDSLRRGRHPDRNLHQPGPAGRAVLCRERHKSRCRDGGNFRVPAVDPGQRGIRRRALRHSARRWRRGHQRRRRLSRRPGQLRRHPQRGRCAEPPPSTPKPPARSSAMAASAARRR
jgi:hypothetical protein